MTNHAGKSFMRATCSLWNVDSIIDGVRLGETGFEPVPLMQIHISLRIVRDEVGEWSQETATHRGGPRLLLR